MIKNNIYCQSSGMVMQCINDLEKDLPVVCEIGCADGQGVARYIGFCSHVISIDPMVTGRPDIVSYKFEEIEHDETKIKAYNSNISFSASTSTLVIGCSAWQQTIEGVKKLASDGIDILLIDGVHHPYEAVWKDFETYYPLVNRGGFIIFDDVYEDDIQRCVDKALNEYGLIQHDHYREATKAVLQEIVALKKIE